MKAGLSVLVVGGVLLATPFVMRHTIAVAGDAPEISRSRGTQGGVVVVWPRIIPGSETAASRALAASIQQRLKAIVARALPGRTIDIRPEPERVCPQGGCDGITVGALLLREDNGCAVVALVSGPGRSATRMIPWAGQVRLRASAVPFREPPESHVTVTDFGNCGAISDELSMNQNAIENAIRAEIR